ncbi:hypothetical protein JOC36_001541 [Weissella uvarum]|uniref:hypothetical protein n=1 Tax=Weissella uvarum TaxID=1479233 RepID=UPI0019610107|nr:hypothetical protein [Weissella uvarum]MBM7617947.1 hypothetical protein [Weissella uvarum]MCM0596166.1 hypothetical protein [Weissella uvarum]
MSLLEGLGKIVAGTGDIINWAGSKLQEGGEYLTQPEAKDEIKDKTKQTAGTVKNTVVDTAQTVSQKATGLGKQVATKVDSKRKGVASKAVVEDLMPADKLNKKPVAVEVLMPHKLTK